MTNRLFITIRLKQISCGYHVSQSDALMLTWIWLSELLFQPIFQNIISASGISKYLEEKVLPQVRLRQRDFVFRVLPFCISLAPAWLQGAWIPSWDLGTRRTFTAYFG